MAHRPGPPVHGATYPSSAAQAPPSQAQAQGQAHGQGQPRASIPISQRQAQEQQARQHARGGFVQSSLDLVFSYSRSQAFFGSNLDTGPSFVARYRRPPGFGPIGSGDEDSLPSSGRGSRERSRTGEGATESESWTEDDQDEDYSGEEGDEEVPPWYTGGGAAQEQLPSNAAFRPGTSAGRPSSSVSPSTGASRSPSRPSVTGGAPGRGPSASPPRPSLPNRQGVPAGGAGEGTPLLGPSGRPHPHSNLLGPSLLPPPPPALRAKLSPSRRRPSLARGIARGKGRSTWTQSCFNSISVLAGVGLLAMPLAFRQAGWILGTALVVFSAGATNYTAKLLSRLQATDPSLQTYADILISAFGPSARRPIHGMFFLELGTLSVALINLWGDSMHVLFPRVGAAGWKAVGFFIVLPTTVIPLRYLSITSIIGILSSFVILGVVFIDGMAKRHQPGSLQHPMYTSWGPDWIRLPSSFGLIMSGFSGHAVFPSIIRDMRRPEKFGSMVNTAYLITTGLYFVMGVLGYLMFGYAVTDEITADLYRTWGYPPVLNDIAIWMVAINPLVKYGLASRPLTITLEHLLGIRREVPEGGMKEDAASSVFESSIVDSDSGSEEESSVSPARSGNNLAAPSNAAAARARRRGSRASKVSTASAQAGMSAVSTASTVAEKAIEWARLGIPTVLTAVIVLLAIVVPSFSKVLALLGSFCAYSVCCILPCWAFLILGEGPQGTVPARDKVACVSLIAVSFVLGTLGTIWAFLPERFS